MDSEFVLQRNPQFIYSATLSQQCRELNGYPFELPAIRAIETIDFHPKVTFLVGENGAGKSTLLEAVAIAWGFNAEGGSKNFRFSTRNSSSSLSKFLKLSKSHRRPRDGFFLRAESFYNVASEIDRLDEDPEGGPPIVDSYGGVSLHNQSHGESFFSLMMNRFRGRGLYILDEPEAALSPTRQLAMLARIDQLSREGAQFIIATHSPILLAYQNSKLLSLDETGICEVAYEETEHYVVMKNFMGNPQAALERLLSNN